MQEWKQKALELLPEIKTEILESDNPMRLWIEIVLSFDEAYEEPINESFIKRVYEYEEWCLEQGEGETAGEHLSTCVVTSFWEHIPTNKAVREDMTRWFTLEEVLKNQQFFGYHLSAGNFEDLVNMYSKSTLNFSRQK